MAMENSDLNIHTDGSNIIQGGTNPNVFISSLNINHYTNKKSAAESMLDLALLMANASQLKAVLDHGSQMKFFLPLIILISLSLCLQILVGVLLIFIVKWNVNEDENHHQLNKMENIATCFIFIIVTVNIFITAFGVQRPNQNK